MEASWTFQASGQQQVAAAFRSIAEAARDAHGATSKAFANMPKAAARAAAGVRRANNDPERIAKRELAATERAEAAKLRLIERGAEKRAKAEVRAAEKAIQARQRAEDRAGRTTLSPNYLSRRMAQHERAEGRERDRRSSRRWGAIGGVARDAAFGAAGASLGAGALVAGAALRESVQLSDFSNRLAIKGGRAGQGDALRKQFENTSVSVRGSKAMDTAQGVEAFVSKTGNLDMGMSLAKTMAELSVATGTETAALGGAMADLYEKFDVKTVDEMAAAMATLAIQGKKGSFELEDAAQQFPKMAAAAQRFGMKGAQGLAELGGLAQLARRSTGSGEKAATAVDAMLRQLIVKSGDIKTRTGTDVFADAGKTRTNNIKDILVGTIAGAKGNLGTLQNIFGGEGMPGISPLISTFNDARNATKGTEAEKQAAGIKALNDALSEAIDATGAEAEIRRDLTAAQMSTGAQLTAAWEQIKSVAGDAAPHIATMAARVAEFVKTADWSGVVQGFKDVAAGARWLAEFLHIFAPAGKPITELTDKELVARGADALGQRGAARSGKKTLAQIAFSRQLTPEENAQLRQLQAQDDAAGATLSETEAEQRRRDALDVANPTQPEFVDGYVAGGKGKTGGIGGALGKSLLGLSPGLSLLGLSGMDSGTEERERAIRLAEGIQANPEAVVGGRGAMSEEQKRQTDAYQQSQLANQQLTAEAAKAQLTAAQATEVAANASMDAALLWAKGPPTKFTDPD